MRYCRIAILFVVFTAFPLSAQQQVNFPVKIDSVIIMGNEKTKDEVLLREIPFDFPDSLTLEDLQFIQNRLNNLFLFNRVEMRVVTAGRRNMLLIQVGELWYIYPVPIFFLNDREWSRVSYGFQLTHLNFRGMNEQLSVGGWLGYNPSFFLRYYNPWMGRKSRLIVSFTAFGKKVGNRFFDFDEQHLLVRLTVGKRLSLHRSLTSTISLRQIKLPGEYKSFSVSGDGTDLIPKLSLTYQDDHRNLIEYPTDGYFINWSISRAGFNKHQPNFWRFDFDHRLYLKLSERFSIGGRNLLRLNRGSLPIYDRIFIGYLERIRGYFDRRMTGQNLMLQSYEMRIKLLPIKYLSWKSAPAFSPFFQNLKYGLSMGIFLDSGIVWNRKEEFSLKNQFTGYGIGLHFHLPYIYIMRLDRAWNDRGEGEWIFEALVSF